MKRAVALSLGCWAGCASYGWADRPGPTVVERPVAVRTIDVDAHAGADAASLTTELVAQLRRAGVHAAEWTGAARAQDVVECDVALVEDDAFGDHAFVAVSTACRVDGELVTKRSADAMLAAPSSDRTLGRRRAAEDAARASLTAAAQELAAHLRR